MSEGASRRDGTAGPAGAAAGRAGRRRRAGGGTAGRVALLALLAVLPFYLEVSLLQTGLFAFSAVIGAIGLNLLTGVTGQLSLGHAFFVAVGAYGYACLAGSAGEVGGNRVTGLGLPPVVALVLAVMLAGVAGLLFSPIASRLRSIYLGIASLALVFIGQHLLFSATGLTGGFNGRNVAPFTLFGFTFTNSDPPLSVLDVPFGTFERLWYLGLALVAVSYAFANNLLRGRAGRGMRAIRQGEVAAAVLGVNVRRYKAAAFVISSMYAGLAGVLFALTVQRVVPGTFGFQLTIEYLAMIVIGGLGSVGGAAAGGAFVAALPLLLTHYSDRIGFLAEPGSGGVDPGSFARYMYGALVVLVLVFEPRGVAALARRLSRPVRRGLRRARSAYGDSGGAPRDAVATRPADPAPSGQGRDPADHQHQPRAQGTPKEGNS